MVAPIQNNVYSLLDENTPTLFSQPLSFTIGQTGGLLSVSILVMTIMLIAIGTVGAGRILYALGLRVANFGEASEANYTKSKKIISTVLFTLVFSFGLVLFALAINPDLVKGTVGWEGLRVGGGAGAIVQPTSPTPAPAPAPSGNYVARLASHNAVVARLSPAGIHTNHNDAPCTEEQFRSATPSCTSLAYLSDETVNMLLRLKKFCNCTVVITGGTEPGHITHGEDRIKNRRVDLKIKASQNTSDSLYNWVNVAGTNLVGTNQANTGNCFARYELYGFKFCDERPRSNSTWAPHFHVD